LEQRVNRLPYVIPNVLIRHDPEPGAAAVPLVFDSPHSGSIYPADFAYAAPFQVLRRAEDAFVDELFETAPRHGAALLAALFPRSYVDPNRHEHEVDPALMEDEWPHPILPSERSDRGLGVIRRLVRSTVPVYDRRLSAAEIQSRIAAFHRPYHDELAALIDGAHGRHGEVWHVNCHSMKAANKGRPRADFVLGDRDGTSCGAEFTAAVTEALTAMGYRVALNRPFRGAELVIRHGRPREGRHSLQIEINRGLYMDEERIEKTAGFGPLKADIDRLIQAIAGFARRQSENSRHRPVRRGRPLEKASDCLP
jgi:N-formylglutamate amidohydrolase